MKIVYFYTDLHRAGGIERITTQKLNYLATVFNYEIHIVLISDGSKSPYFQLAPQVKIHYLDIKYYPSNSLTKIIPRFFHNRKQMNLQRKKTISLLNDINPDICVSIYMNKASYFLTEIHPRSKKIIEFHQAKWGGLMEYKESKYPKLTKYLLTRAINFQDKLVGQYDAFVILTEEDKPQWLNPKNIQVIPNFTDFIEKYKLIKPDYTAKKVICAGRISHHQHKGWDLLIHAWALITPHFPDWELSLVGTSEEEPYERWEQLVSDLQINTIKFYPMSNQIVDYYKTHSIFVLSSRYEGFPMVLVEAFSCGLPIVAFQCATGPAAIITPDKDGYLVEKENVKLFSEKLMQLMANENLRITFGKNAKENVTRFSTQSVMNQWDKLFKKLLNS